LCVGAAACVLPVLFLFVGLGCFFRSFGSLRRRWLWTVVLFLCCAGLLDLYSDRLPNLQPRVGLVGGVLGQKLNQHFFGYFGTVGATIIFSMLYFISLLFLTNFQLGEWLRGLWSPRAAAGQTGTDEGLLERRAGELQKP